MPLQDVYPGTYLPRDSEHGALKSIDYAHDSIHDGQIFRGGAYSALGTSSAVSILIVTGATYNEDVMIGINTDGPGIGNVYEAPDATGGSAITALNANRDSTAGSRLTLTKNPTITTAGTTMGTRILGAEGFKGDTGGDVTSSWWVFKNGTKYLLRFTADAATCRTLLKVISNEV